MERLLREMENALPYDADIYRVELHAPGMSGGYRSRILFLPEDIASTVVPAFVGNDGRLDGCPVNHFERVGKATLPHGYLFQQPRGGGLARIAVVPSAYGIRLWATGSLSQLSLP